jgi:hypothetical protein
MAMVRALAIKELRETAWIWLLAAAWLFVLAMEAMRIPLMSEFLRVVNIRNGRADWNIPFLDGAIATNFGTAMGVFAIALGIRQTAGESRTGTYPLLLHLPMAWRRIFDVKLAVGIGLVWGLGAVSLGATCWWAATPGTHASPFEWGMTADAWRIWFAMPLVYLGAFATGIRPARWFGTRLFPLVAAAAMTTAIVAMASAEALPTVAFVGLVVPAAVAYRIVIGHQIAVRDFS